MVQKAIVRKWHKFQLVLLPNSLYRATRFAYFQGIWGFSVPSVILADLLGKHVCLNQF